MRMCANTLGYMLIASLEGPKETTMAKKGEMEETFLKFLVIIGLSGEIAVIHVKCLPASLKYS